MLQYINYKIGIKKGLFFPLHKKRLLHLCCSEHHFNCVFYFINLQTIIINLYNLLTVSNLVYEKKNTAHLARYNFSLFITITYCWILQNTIIFQLIENAQSFGELLMIYLRSYWHPWTISPSHLWVRVG